MIAHQILAEKIPKLTVDQFAQEVTMGKLAADILAAANKITTLRHSGIEKTKLLSTPETRAIQDAKPVETTATIQSEWVKIIPAYVARFQILGLIVLGILPTFPILNSKHDSIWSGWKIPKAAGINYSELSHGYKIVPVDSTMFLKCKCEYQSTMSRDSVNSSVHEQNYLMGELESLGLMTIRLNEFNDNSELVGLVKCIKEAFLEEYHAALESKWE